MTFRLYPGLLLAGLCAWAGCDRSASETPPPTAIDLSLPKQAQPRLPTVRLWVGPAELTAELAATPRQVETGMMFRTSMGENEGMLFDLGDPHQASFWMKNCPLPLSVAYIDPEGVIREIHALQPHNTNSVVATSSNIRFALETTQGWFERHNVHEGMVVRTERGSLMETFGRDR